MRTFITGVLLLIMSASAGAAGSASHETLYSHCVSNWSAEAVGEVLLRRAVESGYPVIAAEGERSGAKAYLLGVQYFSLLQQERSLGSAVVCEYLVQGGPELLADW